MKHKDNNATSNAKKANLVDSTGVSAQKMQLQAHSLTTIPSDLLGEIAGFLSDKELMRLMITSKEFFNDFELIKTMLRKINESNEIKQLAVGALHTLALTQEGRVLAWGYNDQGQLGLGHNNNQNTPIRVNMMLSSIQALLQYLEDHCRKISVRNSAKSVYPANGSDNADAKERSSSCSTAASSAALFSSGHQSRASAMEGARSTERNGPY